MKVQTNVRAGGSKSKKSSFKGNSSYSAPSYGSRCVGYAPPVFRRCNGY